MFFIGKYFIETPYLLAPMAGVSEKPFRVIAFEMGAGLATTELVSAKGLHFKNKRSKQYLAYDKTVEKPYSLQLFGGDEAVMAQAAVLGAEHGAQIIDINMGCPVKKVTKTGAGSALMCEPKRAASLIRAMRKTTSDQVPITAKIRTGWDAQNLNFIEMGKTLEDAGCAALAMHARTRAQGYSGKANWDLIGELKHALDIPVIGNGDVFTAKDALDMKSYTGCDAVMIGRGALGNPWIFKELKTGKAFKPTPSEKGQMAMRHLVEHVDFHRGLNDFDPKEDIRAIRSFRPHLVWYSKGIKGASVFRENAMRLGSFEEVKKAVVEFFGQAETEKSLISSSVDEAIDYRQAFG